MYFRRGPWNIFVRALTLGHLHLKGRAAIRGALVGCWEQFPKLTCGHCLGNSLGGAVSAPLVGLLAYDRTFSVPLRPASSISGHQVKPLRIDDPE